jgi:hypothetical protein
MISSDLKAVSAPVFDIDLLLDIVIYEFHSKKAILDT